jgi:hypothetical protein
MALDVSIDFDRLSKHLDKEGIHGANRYRFWQALVTQLKKELENLDSNAVFIHADMFTVNGVFKPEPAVALNCKNCGAGITSTESCQYCGTIKIALIPTPPNE